MAAEQADQEERQEGSSANSLACDSAGSSRYSRSANLGTQPVNKIAGRVMCTVSQGIFSPSYAEGDQAGDRENANKAKTGRRFVFPQQAIGGAPHQQTDPLKTLAEQLELHSSDSGGCEALARREPNLSALPNDYAKANHTLRPAGIVDRHLYQGV